MKFLAALGVVVAVASCGDRVPPPPRPAAAPDALPEVAMRRDLAPPAIHRYRAPLQRGESIDVVVTQDGIDVVVEVFAPDGALLATVDSPNGTRGDEPVELVATMSGDHHLVVRSLEAAAPAGSYRLMVAARRDVARTRARFAERARARAEASRWFAARAGAIGPDVSGPGLARFDALAARARVLGIGEPTHGSRQLGDLRVALTLRLVEHHGVRVIALEGSAARFRLIDRWAKRGGDDAALEPLYGTQWINRRAFLALARAIRDWNRAHPRELVTLLGTDPIDHEPARAAFAGQLPPALLARLAVNDADALAFRRTTVTAADWKLLRELVSRLESERAAADTLAAARTLAEFAELNIDADPARSRDAIMAASLLRELGPTTRAAYLAHDAHVAHPPDSPATTGAILRAELGAEYASLATAVGEGGFIAQVAGDPAGRRDAFTLPRAAPASIDGVLAAMALGDAISTWPDGSADAPPWLRVPHPMYWVGGVFARDWLPSQWTRPSRLVVDHDGVVFLARVAAER